MTTPSASFYLWFIVIVVMIPLVLWLIKRSSFGGQLGSTEIPAPMRLVSSLALAPGQRVITVEVGVGDERRWLVLGVTQQSITTLHSLTASAPAPTAPAAQPVDTFHQLLKRLRSGENRDS